MGKKTETEPLEISEAKCTKETQKAILVEFKGEKHWVPKSQVEDTSEVYGAGHSGKLIVSGWIAQQKGWL